MAALADIWKSEKGVYTLALIVAVTAMVFTGHVTVDQWLEYTKWITGFYVAGKTVQGVATSIATRPATPTAPGSGDRSMSVAVSTAAPAPEQDVKSP